MDARGALATLQGQTRERITLRRDIPTGQLDWTTLLDNSLDILVDIRRLIAAESLVASLVQRVHRESDHEAGGYYDTHELHRARSEALERELEVIDTYLRLEEAQSWVVAAEWRVEAHNISYAVICL